MLSKWACLLTSLLLQQKRDRRPPRELWSPCGLSLWLSGVPMAAEHRGIRNLNCAAAKWPQS
eukprot:3293305-Alexandrium_andersonii.AAC.1